MNIELLNKLVWEEMVYANMRANYFGELVRSYQERDKWIRVCMLILTSGSMLTALAALPAAAKITAPVLATAGSLWLLLSQYSTLSRDAADLNSSWEDLARRYERLWNNLGAADAEATFEKIFEDAGKLSRSAAKFPQTGKRINHWFDYSVEMLMSRYKCT